MFCAAVAIFFTVVLVQKAVMRFSFGCHQDLEVIKIILILLIFKAATCKNKTVSICSLTLALGIG